MNKIKVAILGIVHQKGLDFLRQKDFEVFEVKNFEPEYLKEKLEFVDGILLRTSKLDKNILKNCSKLKIISRHGVGYDNVDADYLNQKKIALGITSKSNAVSVAEHVMTFFMYLTKNLSTSDKLVRDGNFKKKSELPDFFELYEKKVLIFGFGRIGKEVAKRCHGFGMKVYVYDPFLDNSVIEEHNCIPTGKKEGLSLADYITIHLPLNEDTRNFISKTEFNVMKKNSIVINTSRGGIINEKDLDSALNKNLIFGAGLDVFEKEPIQLDNPLIKNKKVLLSPHSATYTRECASRMGIETVKNIIDFFDKKIDKSMIVNIL